MITSAFGDSEFDDADDTSLPPLLRRPEPTPGPVPVTALRGARKKLLDNPLTNLNEDAATAVTSGAVDPGLLAALVDGEGTNLLMAKPVVGGTLYSIAPHRRYTDLGVLPDFINQRWAHQLHTPMDVEPPTLPRLTYDTLAVTIDGKVEYLAIFTVRMKDRAALAKAVEDSMRRTHEAQGGANDYTDSVLQQGVKEPLTLFLVRVEYDDGTSDTYLVSGDGNSRLVSMWLARSGGEIDAAARLCIATVIGPLGKSGPRSTSEIRNGRQQVEAMAARVLRGLGEKTLTEATRREGHTMTFPATVVVGARRQDGTPLEDLLAGRDDLLANLHVHVTPWTEGAQSAQGMQRLFQHAVRQDLISKSVMRVLTGQADLDEMRRNLQLPAHRLWATAVPQQVLLAGNYRRMRDLVRQEFGISRVTRTALGSRMGTVVLAPYRSAANHDQAVRTFDNGGTITDIVWGHDWHLTKGEDPVQILDELLAKALAGDLDAVAELTVLGGTAAILEGLLTRDRGSKEDYTRADLKAPYRATPTRILTMLSQTRGGLSMLHSIAIAHVADDPAILPKAFHTANAVIDGTAVDDGQPVIDRAGARVTLEYEWDLVYFANPAEAASRKATLQAEQQKKKDGGSGIEIPEHVRLRQQLTQAVTDASRAASALRRMVVQKGRERDIFGSPEGVDALRQKLSGISDILLRYGPSHAAFDLDLDLDGDGAGA
ncbi:hypothetical protein ABZ883_40270 [Streptomyces sp. NPDC046977]|uniref:hypothetical protein n=1 Tax=Streptomyces sp. NPDC046977 TaxID=3154703 RepID=UPI0033E82C68